MGNYDIIVGRCPSCGNSNTIGHTCTLTESCKMASIEVEKWPIWKKELAGIYISEDEITGCPI